MEQVNIPALDGAARSLPFASPFHLSIVRITPAESQFYSVREQVTDADALSPFPHTHSHYELVYVMEGQYISQLENSTIRLDPGDALLLNRNIRHAEALDATCVCVFLDLAPEFLHTLLTSNAIDGADAPQHNCRLLAALSSIERAALLFRCAAPPAPEGIPPALQLLNQMAEALICRPTGYAYGIQQRLLQLFQLLETPAAYHATQILSSANTEDILYAEILQLLAAHHGRISREDLSAQLHYHPDYLSRIVKQRSGQTLGQLCQQLWVERVKALLRDTDQSVAEIFLSLGFENRRHCSRVFEAHTGMTPQAYRARNRASR